MLANPPLERPLNANNNNNNNNNTIIIIIIIIISISIILICGNTQHPMGPVPNGGWYFCWGRGYYRVVFTAPFITAHVDASD